MKKVEGVGQWGRRYLLALIRPLAEDEGYRVEVEAPIPDGVSLVDLALYHGEESIACKISVASAVEEHEIGCILECLRAGFSWVVLLSQDKRMARKMSRRLREVAPGLDLGRFDVMTPAEFVVHLKIPLPPPAEPGVKDSRYRYGKYRVQVRRREIDPADAEARYRALSEIIGKSLRRMAGLERR